MAAKRKWMVTQVGGNELLEPELNTLTEQGWTVFQVDVSGFPTVVCFRDDGLSAEDQRAKNEKKAAKKK